MTSSLKEADGIVMVPFAVLSLSFVFLMSSAKFWSIARIGHLTKYIYLQK